MTDPILLPPLQLRRRSPHLLTPKHPITPHPLPPPLLPSAPPTPPHRKRSTPSISPNSRIFPGLAVPISNFTARTPQFPSDRNFAPVPCGCCSLDPERESVCPAVGFNIHDPAASRPSIAARLPA